MLSNLTMGTTVEKQLDLIVIIPVYNEQEIIETVLIDWVNSLNQLSISYEINVYNDGSKDDTQNVLNKIFENNSNIKMHHKTNKGHGPTILEGYRENMSRCTWIFQVDSDNEMPASYFKDLWEQRSDFDFVVAKRSNRLMPMPRKIVSFISRLAVTLFYRKSIWDVNSPYRLMRSAFFMPIINKIPIYTFAPNLIISGYAGLQKAKTLEKLVPHSQRKTGEVSIKKFRLFKVSVKSFIQLFVFRFFYLNR